MTPQEAVKLIKARALSLGFDACGIARADCISPGAQQQYQRWLELGYSAEMDYMSRNIEMRYDPRLLHPGTESLIVVAMNYYPAQKQETDAQFAYYAYGTDYHYVVKQYLTQLYEYIRTDIMPILAPNHLLDGRPFTDSAPLMEQYWAVQAGIGFMGRNHLLILPRRGSYYFIGTLAINYALPADKPLNIGCGSCRRCVDACPTQALKIHEGFKTAVVDARRCISYQTIENRNANIPDDVSCNMEQRVYGCDACQQACPWNQRFAHPTTIAEFTPDAAFLKLNIDELKALGNSGFKRLFKYSAVQRAGYKGLLRNLQYLSPSKNKK